MHYIWGGTKYSLCLGHRAQWQSTETKGVNKYVWGLVSHACLGLAVRNHKQSEAGRRGGHFVF